MKQLRVYAPIKGPTGYESFTRDVLHQLHKTGVHVALEEFKNWGPWELQLSPKSHAVLGEQLTNKLAPAPLNTSLNICLPEQVKLLENYRNVLYTMFEVDRIPENWVTAIQQVDEVIVPTDFSKWSFVRSGVPDRKVSVVPIGYDPETYNPAIEPLPFVSPGQTVPLSQLFPIRFVAVCEVTNRKNFWGMLLCYMHVAERIGTNNCCLLLRASNYSQTLSLKSAISQFKEQQLAAGAIRDLPYNIFNYELLVPETAHAAFLKNGTHYFSLSFGEGWDMTAMQCAALGLNVIVPNHSAYTCWLDQSVCTLLPVNAKQPAMQDNALGRLYQNANWVAPDLPAAVDIITDITCNPQILHKKREAMTDYIKTLAWSHVLPYWLEALHL